MESKWVDLDDIPFVQGWLASTCPAVSDEGVYTYISLILVDHNGAEHYFTLTSDMAQRVGWDLIGEARGYFTPSNE